MNFLMILYLALILLGIGFIFLAVLQAQKAKRAARSRLTTQGYVLVSDLKTVHDRRKNHTATSYQPRVTYQYQAKGKTYTTDTIGLGNASFTRGRAEAILAQYPVGEPVTVHYDRANPAKAVLVTQPANFWRVLLLLGVLLVIAGIVTAVLVSFLPT